jgi:hypothetical protein
MHAMSRHSLPCRLACWVAVFSLLLKAAVPMLAAGAATVRGVPVADVCAVYGVALAAARGDHAGHVHHHAAGSGHGDHGPHSAATHDEHCALTALAAYAVQEHAALAVVPSPAGSAHPGPSSVFLPNRDAVATWRARLKQGPPIFS